MPQAIAAVAEFIFTYTSASLATAYAIGELAVYSASMFAINKATAALSPKPKNPSAGSGLEVAAMDTNAAGRIVYGRVRISGVHVLPPCTSGTHGEILHMVLAMAIHEFDSFESTFLDTDEITSSDITAITGSANDGKVTLAGKYKDTAWLRRYTGTSTQNVDFILNAAFPVSWPSTAKGRGIPSIFASFDWGKGKNYTGGAPVVTSVGKGAKCYDPRLDSSPGNDPTNAAYIAWTQNPSLIWANYKMSAIYGQKVLSADIDWTTVVNAANDCDELVAIPSGATQARYTFNGVLMTDVDTAENEHAIIDSMLGKMSDTDGKYRIFAGRWRTPAYEIDKEDWVKLNAIQTTAPRGEDRFNGVVAYYVDPDRNWQRVESFRRYNDVYKSADGGERVWVELEQPHCTNKYEVDRKAEFMLRQSRNGIKLSGVLPPRFIKLRTWDNVTLYFDELGWVAKTFTVASCSIDPTGGVNVTLVEEQSSDWIDLIEAEYATPSTLAPPANNPTTPSEVSNLVLTGLPGTIMASWDEPVVRPRDTRYRLIQANSIGDASLGSIAWDGDIHNANVYVVDPGSRFYWVQAYTNSYSGPYFPNTLGQLGRAQPVDDSTFSQRVLVDEEFQYDTGSKYWYVGSPTFSVGSRSFIVGSGSLTSYRGLLRNVFPVNSLEINNLRAYRTPPQTFIANQVYGFLVRFMRSASITTGGIILATEGVNSAWAYDPSVPVIPGASQAPRSDQRDRVDIALGTLTQSYWYVAQGHVMAPNSSWVGFPFVSLRLQPYGKNGTVDIDKVAMWVANSTAGTGSYYIL